MIGVNALNTKVFLLAVACLTFCNSALAFANPLECVEYYTDRNIHHDQIFQISIGDDKATVIEKLVDAKDKYRSIYVISDYEIIRKGDPTELAGAEAERWYVEYEKCLRILDLHITIGPDGSVSELKTTNYSWLP